jgi:serine/threonine-protein kinase HipA
MRRTIEVFLGQDPVRIAWLRHDSQPRRESAAFEYHAGWLASDDAFAIEPALPLVPGPQFHPRTRGGSLFHGIIADSEPDGWARRVILRDQAKRRQDAPRDGRTAPRALNELDFLLSVDDLSRVGALRFRDEQGTFQRAAEAGRRTAPPLIELGLLLSATRAVETNSESAADLEYLRGRGTSLGGLRPKCSVIDDEGRLSIAKFPSVSDERSITRAEVLALRLATSAGINAASARLVDSDGVPVALIRRFDRGGSGGRIHFASAATMIGADPGEASEHSYTEIVDAIRVHGAAPQSDIEELWRRMAFFILITNVDDHLRNHGFLHVDRGQWRLAPAFDVNPFPERARELKTWISESAGPAATVDGLLSVAPYFRVSRTRTRAILGEVERAVSRWRSVGKRLGMSERELADLADAFEHPERVAARKHARVTA